ncbi:MAG: tail fiber domain-containing protein [Gammaproteobacteria bacterium]
MTVVRAREGTSALSWNTNDLFQLRLTAAGLMAITGAVSALTAGYGINISNASGNFTISDTQTVTAGTNMSVGHTGTVWTVNCTINTALYALLTGATFSGAVQINNNLTVTGTGNFNTSAMNTKENIRDVPLDVARFLRLKPINYTHKEMQEETAGFTAENIYEVYPELVHLDKEGHPFSVNYQGIIPYVAKLVQHHQQTVVSMKKRVEELESQLKKRKKAAH